MSLCRLDVLSKYVQGLVSPNLGSNIITLTDSYVIEIVKPYDCNVY